MYCYHSLYTRWSCTQNVLLSCSRSMYLYDMLFFWKGNIQILFTRCTGCTLRAGAPDTADICKRVSGWNPLLMQPSYCLCELALRRVVTAHFAHARYISRRVAREDCKHSRADYWAAFVFITRMSVSRLLHQNVRLSQHCCDQRRRMALLAVRHCGLICLFCCLFAM